MTRDIIRTERIGPVTVIHLQDDRALNALGSALVAGRRRIGKQIPH